MKPVVPLAVLALAACTPQPSEDDIQRQALQTINADRDQAASLKAAMQKQDPSVIDAYYKLDAAGEKVLVVARQKPDGTIESWETPASVVRDAEQQAQAQQPGMGSSMMGMMTGALAGYMLANAFSSAGRSATMSRDQYQNTRNTATNNYASNVVQKQRASSMGRAVGATRGGSFSGSGTRSNAYGAGG